MTEQTFPCERGRRFLLNFLKSVGKKCKNGPHPNSRVQAVIADGGLIGLGSLVRHRHFELVYMREHIVEAQCFWGRAGLAMGHAACLPAICPGH